MREHAFFVDDRVIYDEAATLLADVLALYEFETYQIFGDSRDLFFDLFSYVTDRIERSLLVLASLARANDDGGWGLKHHAEKQPAGVGVLREGEHQFPLTAREACNKILHAKSAKFSLQRTEEHPIYQQLLDQDFPDMLKTYSRPQLLLEGERVNGCKWEASLDLVQWVHAILHWSTVYSKQEGDDEK